MLWIAIAIIFGVLFSAKLGALSVMVTVLSGGLYVALTVIAILVAALIWRRIRQS